MNKPISYDKLAKFIKIIADMQDKVVLLPNGFKSTGQEEAAKFLCSNDQNILQMYRRSGKSHLVSVLACIYILQGESVIIGSPTLGQSSRIIFKMIIDMVDTFSSILGIRKIRDSLTYTTWDNGGSILALTANMTSNQQEGYGGALLLIDEGHRIEPEILPVLAPSVDDAFEIGIGKIVILGVGGHKSKLIEVMKDREGWSRYRYAASMETQPTKIAVFDKAKKSNSDIYYDQHYECLPCHEGLRLCYPGLPGGIDITDRLSKGLKKIYYFGIDIGKKDETVVVVGERVGDIRNIVDCFAMSGQDHIPIAKAVYNFIDTNYVWTPSRIMVEHNSVGSYFQDTLTDLGMPSMTVTTTERFKDNTWHTSSVSMREGCLGIHNETVRRHLENITYSIKPNGHLDIEHNDYFSAFSMCWSMMN